MKIQQVFWNDYQFPLRMSNKQQSSSMSSKTQQQHIACPSCKKQYNEQNPPRILIMCGHTYCQRCIKNLIKKKKDHKFYIKCLEDQQVLDLDTNSPTFFPKNMVLITNGFNYTAVKDSAVNGSKIKDGLEKDSKVNGSLGNNNALCRLAKSISTSKMIQTSKMASTSQNISSSRINEDEESKNQFLNFTPRQQLKQCQNISKSLINKAGISKLLDVKQGKDKLHKKLQEIQKQEQICLLHQKVLDIICLSDQERICAQCALFGLHKGHPIITIKQQNVHSNALSEKLIKMLDLSLTDIQNSIFSTLSVQTSLNQVSNLIKNKKSSIIVSLEDVLQKIIQQIYQQFSIARISLEAQFQCLENITKKQMFKVFSQYISTHKKWQEECFLELKTYEKYRNKFLNFQEDSESIKEMLENDQRLEEFVEKGNKIAMKRQKQQQQFHLKVNNQIKKIYAGQQNILNQETLLNVLKNDIKTLLQKINIKETNYHILHQNQKSNLVKDNKQQILQGSFHQTIDNNLLQNSHNNLLQNSHSNLLQNSHSNRLQHSHSNLFQNSPHDQLQINGSLLMHNFQEQEISLLDFDSSNGFDSKLQQKQKISQSVNQFMIDESKNNISQIEIPPSLRKKHHLKTSIVDLSLTNIMKSPNKSHQIGLVYSPKHLKNKDHTENILFKSKSIGMLKNKNIIPHNAKGNIIPHNAKGNIIPHNAKGNNAKPKDIQKYQKIINALTTNSEDFEIIDLNNCELGPLNIKNLFLKIEQAKSNEKNPFSSKIKGLRLIKNEITDECIFELLLCLEHIESSINLSQNLLTDKFLIQLYKFCKEKRKFQQIKTIYMNQNNKINFISNKDLIKKIKEYNLHIIY